MLRFFSRGTSAGRVRAVAAASLLALVAATAGAQGILDDPHRTDAERARDAGSKPLEVYSWIGVQPGMTVGDIIPSAGYNTFLLAKVVGTGGRVLAAGTDEQGKQQLEARFTEAGMGNVEVMASLATIPDDSVDIYICVRNVHDMLIPAVAERYGMQPDPILSGAFRSLKPGGIFGVVDARTTQPGADANTHRVNEAAVIEAMEGYGFELVDRSELLANPHDDETSASFEGDGRYTLDRMLLKFRKPAM